MTLDGNDPELTAYALGELEGDELADAEAQIARSETLRRVVSDVRTTADLLKTNLQNEPILKLSPKQRASIESSLANPSPSQGSDEPTEEGGSEGRVRVKSPGTSFLRRHWIPSALAASILVAVGIGYSMRPILSRAREMSPSMVAAIKENEAKHFRYLSDSSVGDAKAPDFGLGSPIIDLRAEKHVSASQPAPQAPPPQRASKEKALALLDQQQSQMQLQSLGYVGGGGGGSGGRGQAVFGGGAGQSVVEPVQDAHNWLVGPGKVKQFTAPSGASRDSGGAGMDAEEQSGCFLSGAHFYGYQAPFGISDAEGDDAFDLYAEPRTGESYDYTTENPFLLVSSQPLSTFSIDVDTASYSNVRRFLMAGRLPPREAVRIEELVNYFDYDYPLPTSEHPFSVNVEVADCPWAPTHRLARIGIKGMEFAENERPPANLVFLIDVSGSMQPLNRLPLLQQGLRMLVDELSPQDSVAIVVYAGASGLVLPSTSCRNKGMILAALDNLQAGGSTCGSEGIQLAYETAIGSYIEGGVNRVILATDGDFNVGITDRGSLNSLIEEKAKSGVFLTVLGVGMGNLKDATLETLADKGNGNYAYIDTLNEAQKVLVDQIGGTLLTIAKDVKIQVEFNPAEVSAYRLIGYENRLLAAQDFNDDKKDAGEIGAGHTVTAFYEIIPAGEQTDMPTIDPLKYQTAAVASADAESGELMTVKLRYKAPDGDVSELMEVPVVDDRATFADCSDDFAFALSVASFGMLLRGSPHTANFSYAFVRELADAARGDDAFGYRTEFIDLVDRAAALDSTRGEVPSLNP